MQYSQPLGLSLLLYGGSRHPLTFSSRTNGAAIGIHEVYSEEGRMSRSAPVPCPESIPQATCFCVESDSLTSMEHAIHRYYRSRR